MRRLLSVTLVVTVTLSSLRLPPVHAQEEDADDNRPEWLEEPVPYDPEEFPGWARDLRRGEIVALGAFPVAMIVSGLGYQLGRFAYQSIDAGQVQTEYAPGFFSPQSGARYSNSERVGLIVSGAVLSIGVAVADFVLGRLEDKNASP